MPSICYFDEYGEMIAMHPPGDMPKWMENIPDESSYIVETEMFPAKGRDEKGEWVEILLPVIHP